MSFGLYKKGANTTDKKLIKRFTKAGWGIDKISNKLSIEPAVIKRIIAFQAGKTPAPVGTAVEPTFEEKVTAMFNDDKDATDIAVELDVELDVVEAVIEGLSD